VRKQTIASIVFVVLVLGCSASSFAQQSADPYTTNVGLRYDAFSRASNENSFVGFSADLTHMLGGFAKGGGWGAGGGVEFEKFDTAWIKEFEAYVHAQGKAMGKRQLSPYGRFGIGMNSLEGLSDLILDFRGGVDFALKPNAPYLFSVMASVKRVLADINGFNVFRLSAGIVLPLEK
jgi:hypothetical protein